MSKIFVNLPVKNLQKSIDFFTALGYTFNPDFTDDKATCMIVSENIFVMLLVHERFQDFIKKEIADATKTTEVILCLDVESKEKVDEMISKAVAAGGSTNGDPQDHGWMYIHNYADPDGHQWELMYADMSKFPQQG